MKTVFFASAPKAMMGSDFERVQMVKLGILGISNLRIVEGRQDEGVSADLYVCCVYAGSEELAEQIAIRKALGKPVVVIYPATPVEHALENIGRYLCDQASPPEVVRVFC